MKTRFLVFLTYCLALWLAVIVIQKHNPLPEVKEQQRYIHLSNKNPKDFTPAKVRSEMQKQHAVIDSAQRRMLASIEPLNKKKWYAKIARARQFIFNLDREMNVEGGILEQHFPVVLMSTLRNQQSVMGKAMRLVIKEEGRRREIRRRGTLTHAQIVHEENLRAMSGAKGFGSMPTLHNPFGLHGELNKFAPVSQAQTPISDRSWAQLARYVWFGGFVFLITAIFFLIHIYIHSDLLLYLQFNAPDVWKASCAGPLSLFVFMLFVETDPEARCIGARFVKPEQGDHESHDRYCERVAKAEREFKASVPMRIEQALKRRAEKARYKRMLCIDFVTNSLAALIALFGAPMLVKAAPKKAPSKNTGSSQKKKHQFGAALIGIIETSPAANGNPAEPFVILRGTGSYGERHKFEAVFQSLPQLPTSILRLGFSSGITPGLRLGALAGFRMEHGSGDFVPDLELRLIASGKGFESFNLLFLQLNIREMVPQFAWFSTLSYTLSFWKWLSFGMAFEGRVGTRNWYLKAGPMLRAGPMQFWFHIDRDGAFVPSAMFVLKM